MTSARPHAVGTIILAVMIHSQAIGMSIPADSDDLLRAARRAVEQKDYATAEMRYLEASAEMEIETEASGWLNVRSSLAHVYSLDGKNREAIEVARDIVAVCETRLGPSDPLTSEAMIRLASLLKHEGRLAEAEPIYRRNLHTLESKYGRKHFFVAKAASRLGSLLQSLNRHEEAEALHQRAMEIAQATAGKADPEICFVLTSFAEFLLQSEKVEQAKPVMERAFQIAHETTDSQLPSAGVVLRKQAEFYRTIGNLDRAEEIGRRALLRLAARSDSDRARYYYYDAVKNTYCGILRDQGLADGEIVAQISTLEMAGRGTESN